jgi:phage shock protein PspC (stress-responsive transcriptional regulator)
MTEEKKKLFRSRTDKMLAGVCGGLAEYFGIDPVIVRVLWVVITLTFLVGLLAYILLWLLAPEEPVTT